MNTHQTVRQKAKPQHPALATSYRDLCPGQRAMTRILASRYGRLELGQNDGR